MFASKSLKTALQNTTALIGAAFVVANAAPAQAADIIVGPGVTNQKNLTFPAQNLVVQTGGTISDSQGVVVSAVVAGSVHNSGTINGTNDTGILVENTGSLGGGINNSGSIFGHSAAIFAETHSIINGIVNTGTISGTNGEAIVLETGSSVTGGIDNTGTIHAESNAAIDVDGGSITGNINNHGGALAHITGSDWGIAVRNNGDVIGSVINAASGLISGGSTGIVLASNANITGSIDNTGTIKGENAITLSATSEIAGGIINHAAGIISGTDTAGIRVGGSSQISGGINNAGLIHGQVVGIDMSGTSTINGVIDNSGTIEAVVGNAGTFGIRVDNSTIADGIVNTAGVDALSGTGDDAVIQGDNVAILVKNGGVINNGTSDFAIDNAGQIRSGFSFSALAGIEVTGAGSQISGGINNTGTIKGLQHGILVTTAGADITGDITNTGTIGGVATGDGIAILATGTMHGDIDNNATVATAGTITGIFTGINISGGSTLTGDINNETNGLHVGTIHGGNTGLQMRTAGHIVGSISNAGMIDGGFWGISMLGNSTITGTIDNLAGGTIKSNTHLAGGHGGIAVGTATVANISNEGTISGFTGISVDGGQVTGSITNTGTIHGFGGTAINVNVLTSDLTVNLDGGHVIGDVNDFNFDTSNTHSFVDVTGNFTTEGNFQVSDLIVDNTKTLTISPTNTVNLHNMSESTGGTFEFGVETAAAGHHGEITVDNVGVDLTNATVKAKVYGTTNLHNGDEILIATGDAAVATDLVAGDLVADNSQLLWNFKAYTGDLLPVIADRTSADDLFLVAQSVIGVVPGMTNNNLAAATALDAQAAPDAGLQAIIDNVAAADVANDHVALNNDLEATLPTVDGGASEGAMEVGAQTQDIADTRIASLRNGDGTSGMAAGASANGASMWLQGYGRSARQDARGGVDGYDADTLGGAVGFDTSNLIGNGVVGAMFNYGGTNVNSKNANTTSTDIKSYGVNIFATSDLSHEAFINGQLGYNYNKLNMDRHNVGGVAGDTAHGDTHSDLWTAKVAVGNDYPADGTLTLTPELSAAYSYLNTNGYTETGSGGNLVVNPDNQSSLKLGIGATASWKLKGANGSVVKPSLHAGYAYDALNDKVQDSSSFATDPANTTFVTEGASPERNSFNAGAGITYLTAASWDLSANYDYQYKQDYAAHSGVLRATSHF